MIILFNTLHQLWLTINELNANLMNHTWLYINELYHWWFDNKDVKKSTKYVNIYTTTRQEDSYIDTAGSVPPLQAQVWGVRAGLTQLYNRILKLKSTGLIAGLQTPCLPLWFLYTRCLFKCVFYIIYLLFFVAEFSNSILKQEGEGEMLNHWILNCLDVCIMYLYSVLLPWRVYRDMQV